MTRARDLADSADKDIVGTITVDGLTVAGNVSVDSGTIKLDGNYPTGSNNVALGGGALENTTGNGNTAIGYNSANSNITGQNNTYLGYKAGEDATNSNNTTVGYFAGGQMSTGSENTALGNIAMGDGVVTGNSNTALGQTSLQNLTSGSFNTAVGRQSLNANTTASDNTAVGYQSLYANTTGADNTAVGVSAMKENTTGNNNSALGVLALDDNTTGNQNTAVGHGALRLNTTANNNTAVGYQAGYNGTTSAANTLIGKQAGYYLTTANGNTFIGCNSGEDITTGQNNTVIGRYQGNQGGLDIRTSSNNIVLSDGDGDPRIYVNSSGQVALGGVTISTGYRVSINSTQTALIGIRNSSSDGDLIQALSWDTSGFATRFYVAASGSGPNGSDTALSIGRNNSTNRSINASGTINASGSDYAEYMVKADTAATINKGDVCGIDVNGRLTTVWADAISFVVKSTDPSYVGGDTWFNDEDRPNKDEVTAEEYAAYEARLEAARATVDRIAFSGQVPVNVTGATVGDFIVPVQDVTGITGQAISSPTLEQYMSAVGKVIAIEDDGRAKIIVKVA